MTTVMIIGAGSAIGSGLVREFREAGWRVIAADWLETAGEGETASRLRELKRDYPNMVLVELSYRSAQVNQDVADWLQFGHSDGVLDIIINCADIDAHVTMLQGRGNLNRVVEAPRRVARHFRDCFKTTAGNIEGTRVRIGKLIYLIDESLATLDNSGGGTCLDVRTLYHRQVRVHVQENQLKGHQVATLMLVVSLDPPGLEHSIRTVANIAMGQWWRIDAACSQFIVRGRHHADFRTVQNGDTLDARPQVPSWRQ
ncbi:hypothetical protein QBC46DRAFT_356486 [Diplogelasinospora grovesii]|uniref:Uncharacterized protein n=1 Tax=Diplogelasinospora grovesii TaxID=303347 RepID=A0AAN6N248_9PEZI|nr:hypothetical protein QBC46DRAFT_356486 [Diplogelasinospora grovesii]